MLKIEIPKDIEEQIYILEYLINTDTREKDKQIHQKALDELKKCL